MSVRFQGIGSILAAIVFAWSAAAARADLVKLKNGGEIRGKIKPSSARAGRNLVTIETLNGALVVVQREHIQFVTLRSLLLEEYESRAQLTPHTVEAHWELAEWCRNNGLKKQREEQLNRLLELDPEHAKARYGLRHAKHDGKWMTRDQLMTSQGYVKYKGRYVTPQELELIEKTQAQRDAEREWYKKVRLWFGWLTGRHAERQNLGLAELQNIDDPDAVPVLSRLMHDHPNKQIRALYVQILSQIKGPKPVKPLVTQSLSDSDHEIRYQALGALSQDQYAVAAPLYVRELKDGLNVIVRRAAAALSRVGNETAVPKLIEALVTTHRYRVRVPKTDGLAVRTDGAFANTAGQSVLPPEIEGMLRTGQLPFGVIINQPQPPRLEKPTKVLIVKYDHKNAEVLSTLRKLTGEDFGYDERTWRLWWNAKKSGAGKVPPLP